MLTGAQQHAFTAAEVQCVTANPKKKALHNVVESHILREFEFALAGESERRQFQAGNHPFEDLFHTIRELELHLGAHMVR